MPENIEKREVVFLKEAFSDCRNCWKINLGKYQNIANAISELGLEPKKKLIIDATNNNLGEIKKAYEATMSGTVGDVVRILEAKKTRTKSPENKYFDAGVTKSFRPKITEPKTYEYEMEFQPLRTAISKFRNTKVGIHWDYANALDPRYLTIENGQVMITDAEWKKIKDEWFTVYLENKQQVEIYEMAISVEEKVNELMRPFWEKEEDPAEFAPVHRFNKFEFADLFERDDSGKYVFNTEMLQHF